MINYLRFLIFPIWKLFWTQRQVEQTTKVCHLKSVDLQYNTLVCLADWPNNLLIKGPMFQVQLFFQKFFKILCKNPFNLFFYFLKENTKIIITSFEPAYYIVDYRIFSWYWLLLNTEYLIAYHQRYVIWFAFFFANCPFLPRPGLWQYRLWSFTL